MQAGRLQFGEFLKTTKKHDVVIVGSGFYGCTLAQLIADQGKRVLILEKRNHLGGNAYSYKDTKTNIEIHKYGSHIFHTNSSTVWNYINQFSNFNNYSHKVISKAGDMMLPVPINLTTINLVFGKNFTPEEARNFLESQKVVYSNNEENLEVWAKSQIGETLYQKIIKGYTQKQWETPPTLLPASIIARLPIRFDYEDRYFTDIYQGMPTDGYGKIFENMLDSTNINIEIETDFFECRNSFSSDQLIIYTGPIDKFFDYSEGELSWRTLDFDFQEIETNYFQENSVINYADVDVDFTRVHEFKYFHPERLQSKNSTIIAREYSRQANLGDEPYYPIGTARDKAILSQYKEMALGLKNVHLGGRLGSYQYLDMHMAINKAMLKFKQLMNERWGQ